MDFKPQAFTGGNIFLDGIGLLGVLKKVELPKLEAETLEVSGSIGKTEMVLPTLKTLSAKIEFSCVDKVILAAASTYLPKVFKLKANASSTGLIQSDEKIEAILGGNAKIVELGSWEMNGEVTCSVEMVVKTFTYHVNNVPVVVYDYENMIYAINGIDQYASIRKNIN